MDPFSVAPFVPLEERLMMLGTQFSLERNLVSGEPIPEPHSSEHLSADARAVYSVAKGGHASRDSHDEGTGVARMREGYSHVPSTTH